MNGQETLYSQLQQLLGDDLVALHPVLIGRANGQPEVCCRLVWILGNHSLCLNLEQKDEQGRVLHDLMLWVVLEERRAEVSSDRVGNSTRNAHFRNGTPNPDVQAVLGEEISQWFESLIRQGFVFTDKMIEL
ncbi:hypothetical protein IQ249_15160 [Lusitaniella coriacea LEGE 07157]|uniref:Uncharacterized protein n=1 Tax=Lusitaniella coriacea LEGE 07157 TaxID=945747 RepID=A0A8J7IVG1_9CYAN|nr:hypothetical protein [Lusitaniella coriacea]MBE9117238.1 hypothetical protein [Lusitaniella coriacea LEGE 07157]